MGLCHPNLGCTNFFATPSSREGPLSEPERDPDTAPNLLATSLVSFGLAVRGLIIPIWESTPESGIVCWFCSIFILLGPQIIFGTLDRDGSVRNYLEIKMRPAIRMVNLSHLFEASPFFHYALAFEFTLWMLRLLSGLGYRCTSWRRQTDSHMWGSRLRQGRSLRFRFFFHPQSYDMFIYLQS